MFAPIRTAAWRKPARRAARTATEPAIVTIGNSVLATSERARPVLALSRKRAASGGS
jgi:hypothetical protein